MMDAITPHPSPDGEKITVLHVDDDPAFGELTAERLESEDEQFEVLTETTAAEGLCRLEERRVDCILSDYDMPDMDGIEFLEAVREGNPDLPFVLYTRTGSEEVVSEALAAGVTDHVRKDAEGRQYALLANRIRSYVERFRARRRVQEVREGYSRLLEESGDFVFTLDSDGTIQYVTPSVERVLGYDPGEFIGADAFGPVHPDDVETAREAFSTLLERPDEGVTVEFRAEHRDGSWRWLAVRGRNLIGDPAIEDIVMNARDITERKRRERELERTKRRFQKIFEQSNDAIMIVDPAEGVIREVNDRASELLGYGREELLSLSPTDLHPHEMERFHQFVARVYEEGRAWTGDVSCLTKAGDLIPVEVSASAVEFDDHRSILAIIRDISDRKERERRLGELHDTTRRLMDAMDIEEAASIGVVAADEILDLDISGFHAPNDDGDALVPVAVTREAEELFGDVPEIDRGESLAWQVYERGEAVFADDVRDRSGVHNPDTPVRSEMLIPVGDQGVFIAAATEAKAFDETDEELARVLASNLESAIDSAIRERELRERERELERENERLEEVASVISHDLRNPLNVIEGHLEMAREECDSDHLDPISSALERSFDIIDDVLTLVRQGQSIETEQAVSLSTLVENCWRNVDTADAEFRMEGDITFRANPDRFRHVLENLFRNAVEHAGPEVTIRIGRLDDGFYIEDDGPGLPTDDDEELFSSGFSTDEAGTGFGLHIVRQIVEAHGWEIAATEAESGGARFEIVGIGS